MGTTPISALAPQVQNRLEETVGVGVFWSLQYEIYTALIESLNEMLMLVGRPTQTVNVPFTIQPNTVWQKVPKGMLCITGIQGPASQVYKVALTDLDYTQAASGSDWQDDVGPTITSWCPLGFNLFAVHPCVTAPQTVLMTGIAYPATDGWPYTGAETVPFSDEFFSAFEKYAAHYARIKEAGGEFSDSIKLLQGFMEQAHRMTAIQSLRDQFIFNKAIGVPTQANPTEKR